MSRRLPKPTRGPAIQLHVAGKRVRAHEGETLAAALAGADQAVLSRSLKYHRPRGAFCMDGHCSGCLMRINGEPNQRACMHRCRDGDTVDGQNALPSPRRDLLGAVDYLFSKGMNHHTLMTGSALLNKVTQKVVRQLSGLGELPSAQPEGPSTSRRVDVDVLVIGGGPAGLAAATHCAASGASTLLLDEGLALGGSLRWDPRFGPDIADARAREAQEAGATLRSECTALCFVDDEGGITVAASANELLRIRSRVTIHASGSYAQNLPFVDNDRPGVVALRAAASLLLEHGILIADNICMVGDSDPAGSVAAELVKAGAKLHRVHASEMLAAMGSPRITKARVVKGEGHRDIPCEAIVVAGIPTAASELIRQQGGAVELRPESGGFVAMRDERGTSATPGVYACGDLCGYAGPEEAASDGRRVAQNAIEDLRTFHVEEDR